MPPPALPALLPSPSRQPFARACLCCALLLSLLLPSGCAKKDRGILVLDAQSREALSLPQLRPLALPPRYNLDGGDESLSRPAASLSEQRSVRISELAPATKGLARGHKDAAFLKRLRLNTRDPGIRRRIAEETRQAVPLSQPLLDAILRQQGKTNKAQP